MGAAVSPATVAVTTAVEASGAPAAAFVPEGAVDAVKVQGVGCSSGGGSLAVSGVLLMAAWLLRPRRVVARVRASGRG
jgi:uncharacterized protein (TIGR03382 family)